MSHKAVEHRFDDFFGPGRLACRASGSRCRYVGVTAPSPRGHSRRPRSASGVRRWYGFATGVDALGSPTSNSKSQQLVHQIRARVYRLQPARGMCDQPRIDRRAARQRARPSAAQYRHLLQRQRRTPQRPSRQRSSASARRSTIRAAIGQGDRTARSCARPPPADFDKPDTLRRRSERICAGDNRASRMARRPMRQRIYGVAGRWRNGRAVRLMPHALSIIGRA